MTESLNKSVKIKTIRIFFFSIELAKYNLKDFFFFRFDDALVEESQIE